MHPMNFGQAITFRTVLRRCVALIALAGMLYASSLAIIPYAMASPAGPDMVDHAAMDHSGHAMPASTAPAVADMPCDQGCVLCDDCAVCVMALLLPAGFPLIASPYQPLRPPAERTPPGHLSALPAEPPRV